ncbi:hypothetical protein IRB23M11_20830 [Alkalibacterium sp. m-11]
MSEEIIVLSPDRLGYKDRGIMKWQGMILSDHTSALKELHKEYEQSIAAGKEQMTTEEVSEALYKAYRLRKPVAIQANVLKEGHFYPDVKCIVKGYDRDNIYLQLKDSQLKKVNIYLIRHVEYMNPAEWYVKKEKRTE